MLKQDNPSKLLYNWVVQQCSTAPHGTPLPAERELARQFGLSMRTAHRVMRRCADEGRVVRIRNKGTFVAPLPVVKSMVPVADTRQSGAQTLADSFVSLLASGELLPGDPLPPQKYVTLRFGVASATVSAAYRELIARGLAFRAGKRSYIGPATQLLQRDQLHPLPFFYAQNVEENLSGRMLERLERELALYGFGLIWIPLEDLPKRLRLWRTSGNYPLAVAAGHISFSGEYDHTVKLLKELQSGARLSPVRILLLGTGWDSAPPRGMEVFQSGTVYTTVCRAAAGLIARQGATSMTLYINEPALPHGDFIRYLRLVPLLMHVHPGIAWRCSILARSAEPATLDGYLRRYGRAHLQSLLGKYRHDILRELVAKTLIVNGFDYSVPANDSAPIQVFSHDRDCATAQQFHRSSSRQRPVSMLSFENSLEYRPLGIATCFADWEAIGAQLAHALIGDIPLARTTRGYIRPKVQLFERQTLL